MNTGVISRSLICCVFLFLSSCAGTNEVSLPQNRKMLPEFVDGVFPVKWIPQLQFAYEDFSKTIDRNHECFTAYLSRWEGGFSISFSPNMRPETLEERRASVPQERCGQGITYRFDKSGTFLRKHGNV